MPNCWNQSNINKDFSRHPTYIKPPIIKMIKDRILLNTRWVFEYSRWYNWYIVENFILYLNSATLLQIEQARCGTFTLLRFPRYFHVTLFFFSMRINSVLQARCGTFLFSAICNCKSTWVVTISRFYSGCFQGEGNVLPTRPVHGAAYCSPLWSLTAG